MRHYWDRKDRREAVARSRELFREVLTEEQREEFDAKGTVTFCGPSGRQWQLASWTAEYYPNSRDFPPRWTMSLATMRVGIFDSQLQLLPICAYVHAAVPEFDDLLAKYLAVKYNPSFERTLLIVFRL